MKKIKVVDYIQNKQVVLNVTAETLELVRQMPNLVLGIDGNINDNRDHEFYDYTILVMR